MFYFAVARNVSKDPTGKKIALNIDSKHILIYYHYKTFIANDRNIVIKHDKFNNFKILFHLGAGRIWTIVQYLKIMGVLSVKEIM